MYEPGQTFQGKYVLEEILGQGGFGTVFRAIDPHIDRQVALKVLARDDPPDGYTDELRHRFRTEAAAVARLSDPHSVTLLDYGESTEGFLYLLFEFVDGMSLHSLIQEQGPVPPHIALGIARQVLLALREAHAQGILHRDVKPDNVIIYEHMGDPFRAKLVDFGLAKEQFAPPEEGVTRSGALVGTPRYMSPEALFSRPITAASDLFSLGLVLYEMVVGEPANHEPSPLATATRMCSPEEFAIPGNVDPEIAGFIQRLIRKEPRVRFQSVDEALAHLEVLAAPPQPSVPTQPLSPVPMPAGTTQLTHTSSPRRELDRSDFGDELSEPLELARVDRVAPTPTIETVPPLAKPRGDGTVKFGVVLVALLAAASAGAIWYLDMEVPWNAPEPVAPATFAPRTFDVMSEDTIPFYLDPGRGIVLANSIAETPARSRCAMILESRSSPTPKGAFYAVDLVDRPSGPVTIPPIGKEELFDRADVCDLAGIVADEVVLTAEILGAESKLGAADGDVRKKKRRTKRRRVVIENIGVDSAPQSGPASRGGGKREALRKTMKERGTTRPGMPTLPAAP